MKRPAYGVEWAAVAMLLGSAALSAACGEASAPEPTGAIETGDMQIQVSQDGTRFHTVVGGQALAVGLQDPEEAAVLRASGHVPAGVYRYVRLIINQAQATLASGSEIGGLDLPSDITLSLGGSGEVILEKLLVQPLHVTAATTAQLLVDFNSERWVTEDNVLAGQVRTEDLAAALTAGSPAATPALLISRL